MSIKQYIRTLEDKREKKKIMNQYLNTDAYDGFPISERDGWKKEMEVSRELME